MHQLRLLSKMYRVVIFDWSALKNDWNFIDVILAREDANSKLVEVVTVADVSDEDRVGNSLLQIWKLRFGHKAKFYSDLELG